MSTQGQERQQGDDRVPIRVDLPRTVTILIAAAAAFIVVYGMQYASSMLTTIILAFVLTLAIAPLMNRMARHMPTWLAFLLTALIVILVISSLVAVLGGTLLSFADTIPKYESRFAELAMQARSLMDQWGIPSNVDIVGLIDIGRIGSLLASFVAAILDALSGTALLLVLIFFMMIDAIGFKDRFDRALVDRPGPRKAWSDFAKDTRRYLGITAWTGLGVGLVDAALLMMLGVDYAILWGLLAFLFSFIPNVGFILSLIPPAILALLEFGFTKMLIVIVGYIVINNLVDNVIKPRIIGDDLDLTFATTFLSLIFWGWVLGPIGTILAIPMTLMVKHVMLLGDDDTRWVARLMSLGPKAERQAASAAVKAEKARVKQAEAKKA